MSLSFAALTPILSDVPVVEEERSVSVLATGTPPRFVVEPLDPTAAAYGVRVNFTGIVKDNDSDPLTVTWYWGDGNVNVTTTGPAGVNTIIRNGHIYTPPIQQGRGTIFEPYKENLTLRIMLDDGNGNFVNCTTLVTVTMPPNGLPVRPDIYLNGTSSTKIDPSAVVYVVANSSDPEGESLTWTYVFTNAADEVYRVAAVSTPATAPGEGVWVNISHSFLTAGLHQIDIYVSDALIPYQIFPHNLTNTKYAEVVVNSIPGVGDDINVDPNEPVINGTIGYKLVNYTIDAYDADGDVITVTWDFGDGLPVVVNTSAGGIPVYKFYQTRNYTEPGIFNVTVEVTDGRVGHEVYRYTTVYVNSTNRPPNLAVFRPVALSGGIWALPNETIDFEMVITDVEQDVIEVLIDWGDGSEITHFFLTEYVDGNLTILLNHSYSRLGNFTITVNYTDNEQGVFNHNKSYSLTIETRQVFIAVHEGWSWWDFTSLGLICMIPVSAAVWAITVSRKRRRLEKEGLTIDEWKLLQEQSVLQAAEQEKKD